MLILLYWIFFFGISYLYLQKRTPWESTLSLGLKAAVLGLVGGLVVGQIIGFLFHVVGSHVEAFHFEVSPIKEKCCGALMGTPVHFEYAGDSTRFNCNWKQQPESGQKIASNYATLGNSNATERLQLSPCKHASPYQMEQGNGCGCGAKSVEGYCGSCGGGSVEGYCGSCGDAPSVEGYCGSCEGFRFIDHGIGCVDTPTDLMLSFTKSYAGIPQTTGSNIV